MIRRAIAPWCSLLGKIHLRRPDVAENFGLLVFEKPDFGFAAYPASLASPVSISIFDESRAIELQDWRHRPSADVINTCSISSVVSYSCRPAARFAGT